MALKLWSARALLFGSSTIAIVAAGSAQAQQPQWLDPLIVTVTKTEEKASESLAAVSTVRQGQIDQIMPKRISDLLYGIPGASVQERGDEPGTSINIRGLQDFGRVAVVIDGARQNFQRTGHFANGQFYLDPEMLAGLDIVRGPVANIYGSGAIGGVASFRTKDVDDILRPGERYGALTHVEGGTNTARGLSSVFGAARVNPNFEVIGGASYRSQANFKDGSGYEIPNTANTVKNFMSKVTVRPADGHEVKLGALIYDTDYRFGQPSRPGQTGSSIYATDTTNYTTNLRWRYSKPDDKLIDWDANVYWNRTDSQQTKVGHTTTTSSVYCGGPPGNNISGCIGSVRSFLLDTAGFDAHNSSRVDFGDWRNTFTYGGDAFNDKVVTADTKGTGDLTTPGGERTVGGAFAQWKINYATWLEVISAARYDQYELSGLGTTSSGDRVSPKITVGITPFRGFTPYATYAEGYRAPTLTETIIAGAHPTGGGPGLFTCPDGTPGLFCFLPNPNLRPEVGKTKEVGLNLRYDDIFGKGDSFRGKFNLFRNDVEDYIDLTGTGTVVSGAYNFYQYQNIPAARIEGFEFETMYDAGSWFAGLSGQTTTGKNAETGVGLVSAQPNKVSTTGGVRMLDRKLTVALRWTAFDALTDLPANYIPTDAYNLVNLYVGYQPHPDVLATFSIDNLLDQYYLPYPVPRSSSTDSQFDSLWASHGPGITYKAGLQIRFAAM
jgi:hemoglobin/transferrin/lactoferrin receptor protein